MNDVLDKNGVSELTSLIKTYIDEQDNTINEAKQDKLTQTQLNAVNSGIDSSKVAQIETNRQNILTKQDIIDNSNKLDADLVNDVNSTNKFVTSSEKAQITTNQNDIATINSKIMAGTTTQNQLTNVDFVNSSIGTNTANFIGTFSNIVDLENYSGTLTNNDYAFVTNKVINQGNAFNTLQDLLTYVSTRVKYVTNYDYGFVINASDNTKIDVYRYDISINNINERWLLVAEGIDEADFQKNPAYNRYKYTTETTPAQWLFEYTLNNSSFTASQWATINSGLTAEDKAEPFTTAEMEDICDDIFYPALPAPTNVEASGTNISFDEVQGAESYIVYANGNELGEVTA